jgi:hypothetical protein
MSPPGQPRVKMIPISGDQFEVKEMGIIMAFEKEESGEVNKVTLKQGSNELAGERVIESDLTAAEMEEYTGDYFSDELDAKYILYLKDGKLMARVRTQDPIELVFSAKDKFNASFFNGHFIRDKGGKIIGISFNAGRVKNMEIKKI